MYGLEKKEPEQFAFDLEEEIKNDPDKGEKYIQIAEQGTEEIKKIMRSGQNEKDFDKLGRLLHGYKALRKVLNKVAKS